MAKRKMLKFIADASVIIDFIKCDIGILGQFSRGIGQIYVLQDTIDEVKTPTKNGFLFKEIHLENGLLRIEDDFDDAFLAASLPFKRLSQQDTLCFLTAKRHGMCVMTVDPFLYKICTQNGVLGMRSFRILIEMCGKGLLTKKKALESGRFIHLSNKRYDINVLNSFQKEIKEIL